MIDPKMPNKVSLSLISEVFVMPEGSSTHLKGWVSSKSEIGRIVFIVLRDSSGYIQVAGKKEYMDSESFKTLKEVTIESAVAVYGNVRVDSRSPGGKEVSLSSFKCVSQAQVWPISKSAIKSRSFLYDNRHLSIRGKKILSVMKIRAMILQSAFQFFANEGFHLINAPTIVQSASEGGSTLFSLDYFGQPAYLTQSSQFYEEAAICGLGQVFVIQPAFRAEKSKTSKHLTEFWMIEAEKAFMDQEENMCLQENFLTYICNQVADLCKNELGNLGRKFTPPKPPFIRITYDEVLDIASNQGVIIKWGEDISTEAEILISKKFQDPFFITDYPLVTRGFYHLTKPGNSKLTLSADLIAPEGHGEIATGGQRIHDYNVLLKRINEQSMSTESFKWYLDLRRFGMPPHSGFGIGVERVIKWVCDQKHIRSTSLFPRTLNRIDP